MAFTVISMDLRHFRHLITACLAALLLVAAVSPASAAPGDTARYERAVVKDTNAWRITNDLPVTGFSSCLDRYANSWAKTLATRVKSLKHRTPSQLRTIMRRCGKTSIAENLAANFPDGSATVRGWMGSPGHNRNMLGSSYRSTGVGAYYGGGRWYVVQLMGS